MLSRARVFYNGLPTAAATDHFAVESLKPVAAHMCFVDTALLLPHAAHPHAAETVDRLMILAQCRYHSVAVVGHVT